MSDGVIEYDQLSWLTLLNTRHRGELDSGPIYAVGTTTTIYLRHSMQVHLYGKLDKPVGFSIGFRSGEFFFFVF